MLSTNTTLIPLTIYLIAVFGLAYWSRRQTNTKNFLNEYLVGGRSLGGFMLAMTLAATYAGASSFIGGPGAAYNMGLGWVLLAMIQVPTAWLTLGVLGKKFAMEARRYNALTINDILYARYKSRAVVILASLSLLLTFFVVMVVQFVGGARLLETVTGLPYTYGLIIFACIIGVYTTIGGFRAVVVTDVLQGVMMIIGTIALLIGVIHAGGGLSQIMTDLHAIEPALISPYGPPDAPLGQSMMLSFWVLVCFGIIAMPQSVIRCMSYKDTKSLHSGMVIGTIIIAFLMLGMHLVGALGRALMPDLTVPDNIMPELMMYALPPVVAGVFLAGPMAAIMSTIDSMLIQASATLIKDLYINYINPSVGKGGSADKKLPKISQCITTVFITLVFIAALNPPNMIIWLNLLALGATQAVFLWPLVLGLYWEKSSATGALSSMAVGLITFGLLNVIKPDLGGIHPIVPTLSFGLIAFIIGSLVKPKQRTYSEI